jgi:hypothetical protein
LSNFKRSDTSSCCYDLELLGVVFKWGFHTYNKQKKRLGKMREMR